MQRLGTSSLLSYRNRRLEATCRSMAIHHSITNYPHIHARMQCGAASQVRCSLAVGELTQLRQLLLKYLVEKLTAFPWNLSVKRERNKLFAKRVFSLFLGRFCRTATTGIGRRLLQNVRLHQQVSTSEKYSHHGRCRIPAVCEQKMYNTYSVSFM